MKYMHFNSSCSYAALATLMAYEGVDTEDYQIALEMKLPWLFTKEDGEYRAGPMLQGGKWFNLWLLPRGYQIREEWVRREALGEYLRPLGPAMLGLRAPGGKHACVFSGYADEAFHFINPIHEGSDEPVELTFSPEELLLAADEEVVVGVVVPTEPQAVSLGPYLRDSISVIRENCAEIKKLAAQKQDPDSYFPLMNSLFRPLLLDGISMLELAGEKDLAREFTLLQQQFMAFLKGTRQDALGEMLSLDKLQELTEEYVRLIEAQME